MQASTHDEDGQIGLVRLTCLALLVGVVTGLGALIFRELIAVLHNLFFLGDFSLTYDSEHLMPLSPWGVLVILVPVVGGMGVVWLARTFAPEARGHGVPEVMDAIYHKEGEIRPVVALAKSLASALSIGSGAAVGREGPIIQIGASLGSTCGQLFRIATWQRITLIAAGAGAGIAATFNTPLGGVMFAIELMLPEVSSRTFLPVVLATAAATYVGRVAFGIDPAFIVPIADAPAIEAVNLYEVVGVAGLGVLCGLASLGFIRLLSFMEHAFETLTDNDYFRHGLGMLGVGAMMYVLGAEFGHYFIQGTGYGTITAVLQNQLTALDLVIILFFAKLLATTLSLGSGASGGIFSPSLFLGTTLGAASGGILNALWPEVGFNAAEFAMIGMAGVVGGATGAAMTAIVMVFEMTRDYNIIVPMVIAVALSIGVRRVFSSENIYTVKLAWRGKSIPKERHTNMFLVQHAGEVMEDRIALLPANWIFEMARQHLSPETDTRYIVAVDGERVVGVVPLGAMPGAGEDMHSESTLGELASPAYIAAQRDDILHDLLKRMTQRKARFALVTPNGKKNAGASDVLGVIGKDGIADSVMQHFRA